MARMKPVLIGLSLLGWVILLGGGVRADAAQGKKSSASPAAPSTSAQSSSDSDVDQPIPSLSTTGGSQTLDFEADLIEGQKLRPSFLVQVATQPQELRPSNQASPG